MSNQPSETLTLRDYPIIIWLVCLVFVIVGLSLMRNSSGMIAGIFFVLIGGFFGLFTASINTVTASRSRRMVSIQRQSLSKNFYREFTWSEVAFFDVEMTSSSRGGRSYRLVLYLNNGEKVPVQEAYTSGESGKRQKADRLNQYLHVKPSPSEQLPFHIAKFSKDGITGGISWRIETLTLGASPVTRWISDAIKNTDQFLLLAQKPKELKPISVKGGLAGNITRQIYRQMLHLYGFQDADIPGFDQSVPLDPSDPRLDPYFATLTSDPAGARRFLNPWFVTSLIQWAEAHPMKKLRVIEEGEYAQLLVLYSPQGLYLAFFNEASLEQIEAISRLGAELVQTQ